jgi:chaperonin GroES
MSQSEKSPLTPLADRIVAIREEAESKTAAGLYIPDGAKEKPSLAVVIATGPEVKYLKVGDRIAYKQYAESLVELKHKGKEYIIIRESGVAATVAK